jgi:hypothetical protein
LEGLARHRQILIDENTFKGLGELKSEFNPISRMITGGTHAVNVFSLMK